MSNQPPADPDQPWKKPEQGQGEPSPDSPTSSLPVSGNPWSTPSGDTLAPEPYRPPAMAEPPEAYQPPTGAETPGADQPPTAFETPVYPLPQPPATAETPGHQPPKPPAAPTFKPGHASLPAPQPLPPTSTFPQQPRSAPSSQGGYPPQPDPSQPYPPPAYAPDVRPGPQQPYSATSAYSPSPGPGYAAHQSYAGQQGGYGPPPGYGQPPAGYGQPPKRSNVPIVAVILAVALLLCGGVATAGVLAFNRAKDRAEEALKPITDPVFPTEIPQVPDVPTEVPDLPTGVPGLPTDIPGLPTDIPDFPDPNTAGKTITVVYEVTGDGPASIIYTEKLGKAPKRLDNVDLPWQVETTMKGAALISVTAVRSGTDTGKISCRATADGEEVAQVTREGTFATASCIKMVF